MIRERFLSKKIKKIRGICVRGANIGNPPGGNIAQIDVDWKVRRGGFWGDILTEMEKTLACCAY
jgi:hypothetical protein